MGNIVWEAFQEVNTVRKPKYRRFGKEKQETGKEVTISFEGKIEVSPRDPFCCISRSCFK